MVLKASAGLTAIAMAVAFTTGCAKKSESESGSGEGEGGKVTVGWVNPMSGPAANVGQNGLKGARLALDELRAAGTLGDVEVELKVQDDKCSPSDAVNAAQKVIDEGADVLVGPACSSAVLAVLPVLGRSQVPAIAWVASALKITESRSKEIFRLIPNERTQAIELVNYLAEEVKPKRIAIAVEQTDAGLGARDAWRERIAEVLPDAEIVEDVSVNQNLTDFSQIVSRIAKSDPEVVLALFLFQQGVQFTKAADARGLDATIMNSTSWPYPLFEEAVGEAANGVVRQLLWMRESTVSGSEAFVDGFKEKYGEDVPDQNAPLAYDAMKLVGQLIADGARTKEELLEGLRNVQYDGVTGPISFDEKGQVKTNPEKLLLVRTVDGRAQVIR